MDTWHARLLRYRIKGMKVLSIKDNSEAWLALFELLKAAAMFAVCLLIFLFFAFIPSPNPDPGQEFIRILCIVVGAVSVLVCALASALHFMIFLSTLFEPPFVLDYVSGPSMAPSLREGDWLVIKPVSVGQGKVGMGDIVCFFPPIRYLGQSGYLMRRVIAESGDTVQIRDGRVFVNGDLVEAEWNLRAPYLDSLITEQDIGWPREKKDYLGEPIVVPEYHYFVLADNRECGEEQVILDSRIFGCVPRQNVVGRLVRILPQWLSRLLSSAARWAASRK